MTVNVSSRGIQRNSGGKPGFPGKPVFPRITATSASVWGTELLPRQRMASVPYAIQAGMIKMPYKARAYRNVRQDFPHQY
ncbi:MAG: hypothetical protein R2941_15750 [Desulfobacterales bacterium]